MLVKYDVIQVGENLPRPGAREPYRALARETGLEPATSGVTGRRSNQLSYSRFGGGEALGREPPCVKRIDRTILTGFW